MCKSHMAFCLAIVILVAWAHTAGAGVNLLANGGFENDSNHDGVPDGWLGDPANFSRETLASVQDYVCGLPPRDQLLAEEVVKAADGWVIARRGPEEDWDAEYKTVAWYMRLASKYLPQNSRSGRAGVGWHDPRVEHPQATRAGGFRANSREAENRLRTDLLV